MAVQNKQPVATEKYRELDKKRWLVRYLVLASIAVILGIKLYLLIYVVDFTVGFYSFLTSFLLFNIFFLSYVKYRDPFVAVKDVIIPEDQKPLVSILVPVKNEVGNIRNCVQSCLNSSYSNKEVIIINDASTDGTAAILDEMRKEGPNLKIMHLSKSMGKKGAIEAGSQIAKGEIYAMMDSDCDLASDAIEHAVKIFYADRRVGAVTGHARVRGAATKTLLKIMDVWFDGQFRLLKGMETSFSSLTCCSGALSIYRRDAVHQHIHAWAHDDFLGIKNFKFATDRRLTAYVLGAKPEDIWKPKRKDTEEQDKNKNNNDDDNIPIIQTGRDDLNTLSSSSDPDEEDFKKKDRRKYAWRLVYSPNVRVTAGVPETLMGLIRQQIRWRKSFIRSITATGGIYWRRPAYSAFLYYLILALKLTRPFIVVKALLFLPIISGDLTTSLLYIAGIMYTGMLYGIDVRLRNPGYPYWLYRPVMTGLSTFVLSWLIFYAAITIRKESWR
jgi:hyaluronan synthase